MSKRSQHGFTHPPEQFAKRRIPRQVAPEDQCVDEEANQLLQLQRVSSRDPGADEDVFAPGIPVQQSLEDGQQQHEQGDSLLSA